ncbi:MAG TPA: T9SS type A sorting domain-containing protein [Bacteroidia bacterium]|nr:T9SS type A sorting domain-containing protein [Bacteroidia bacterium]HNT79381.1 T9SS type A sorting domain-containing protein [Bacteroidia bacterium]
MILYYSTFKRTLIFSILIFFAIANTSQAQFIWAFNDGGNSSPDANISFVRDSQNKLLICGDFTGTQSFGTNTFVADGFQDMFIAKYDSSGASCNWAIKGGGQFNSSTASAIAVDNNNDVYVFGIFTYQFNLGTFNLTTNGGSDIYIAKIDGTNGTVIWLNKVGSTNNEDVFAVLARNNNTEFYFTGSFIGSLPFGSLSANASTSNSQAGFITKMDKSGNFSLVKSITTNNDVRLLSIKSDNNSNFIYTSGSFAGNTNFGGSALVSANTFNDAFVAKYDNNLNLQFAAKGGGAGNDIALDVSNDANDNVYFTGYFYGSALFGSTNLTELGMGGAGEMYIAKLNSAGVYQWAKKGGSSSYDAGNAISCDQNGACFVTGVFNGSAANFGLGNMANTGGTGTNDMFLVKYNTNNTTLISQKAGSVNIDKSYQVELLPQGYCIMAGYHTQTANFGTYQTTSNIGTWKFFIAKYSGGSVGIDEAFASEVNLNVSPNPLKDQGTLTFESKNTDHYTLQVFSTEGKLCLEKSFNANIGTNLVNLNLSHLSRGIYHTVLQNNKRKASISIIKGE